MSEGELRKVVGDAAKAAVADALGSIEERFGQLDERVRNAEKSRNLALITALICLLAAAASVPFAILSQREATTAQDALRDQQETNLAVVCSSARSTALAFRERQVGADGTRESKEHYLERLVAQRATLLAAGAIKCPSIPGFDAFPFLRARALAEIDAILRSEAPRRFRHLPPATPVEPGANLLPDDARGAGRAPTIVAATPENDGGGGGGDQGGASPPGGSPPPDDDSDGPTRPPKPPGDGGGDGGKEGPPPSEGDGGTTPTPPPPPTTPPPAEPPPPPPPPEATPSGGIIGDPGGLVGEVLCLPNRLGIIICAR